MRRYTEGRVNKLMFGQQLEKSALADWSLYREGDELAAGSVQLWVGCFAGSICRCKWIYTPLSSVELHDKSTQTIKLLYQQ